MLGCLTFPFRILALVVLIALLYLGWQERDRIRAAWEHRDQIGALWDKLRERPAPEAEGAVGRPSEAALASARDKVDSLNGWRADSVVLTANEAASLVGAGLDRRLRGDIDSLRVILGDGRLALAGRIRTASLPKDALGPFGGSVEPWESIRASGALAVVSPGVAGWKVDAFRVRDFDFPSETIPRLIQLATGSKAKDATVRVAIPEGIGGVRVHPDRVVVYPSGQQP